MAVTPDQQRRGVGGALVEAALARLRAARLSRSSWSWATTRDHTRFGFVPASRYGLRCVWDVPDEAFMVHVIDPAATAAAAGLISYRPEFLMEMPG